MPAFRHQSTFTQTGKNAQPMMTSSSHPDSPQLRSSLYSEPPQTSNLRLLLVAEHASMRFGGEAALPMHYFRLLRQRGIEVWLVVHERTRQELADAFPEDFDRIHFIPDTVWHRLLCQPAKYLPKRIYDMTFGFALTLLTQVVQRQIVKQLVKTQQIDVVHQPIQVSPKTPSMIFAVGAPVVMGPLNGGMSYPPGFRQREGRLVIVAVAVGRFCSNLINTLMPGKQQADVLLVANQRTRKALPSKIRGKVMELVENGVNVSLWQAKAFGPSQAAPAQTASRPTRFVFSGRLVDWKAIDLLLLALHKVGQQVPAELEIVGDGPERANLEQQAKQLGLLAPDDAPKPDAAPTGATVRFLGWRSQADCAQAFLDADVMVLPSLFECGGAVVLEAMAVGLPVIATNWGGPQDYVTPASGILVEPTDPEAFVQGLADAMIRLANSPQRRTEMGQAGRQRVLAEFDWEKKIDRIIEIYTQMAAEEPVAVK